MPDTTCERTGVRLLRYAAVIASTAGFLASGVMAGEANRVTDEASAIAAAKKYVRAQCTVKTPCRFKPRREGTQWNVLVEFTKRNPGEQPRGYVLLYFNQEGQLVRRVAGE